MHRLTLPLLLLSPLLILAQEAPRLQEPWSQGYKGDDSTGKQVLGHWKFDGDNALKDQSGRGADLTLLGAKVSEDGKFGGALESFPGFPVEDKQHGAKTAALPHLNPRGAFSMELWIAAKKAFTPEQRCYLLDKKYVDHTGYQWQLGSADKGGSRHMTVTLGFGTESHTWLSEAIKLEPGAWHHLAFTYDAAGEGRFYLDGGLAGVQRQQGCGAVTQGTKPLMIGDRLGSNYGGFPGYIDEVRICEGVLNYQRASLAIEAPRHVLRRMEPEPRVEVLVTNLMRETMEGAKVRVLLAGREQGFDLPKLRPGKAHPVKITFNTGLKPGRYPVTATLSMDGYQTTHQDTLTIVPRALPYELPVIMWGASPEDTAKLKDIGFTHCLGLHGDVGGIWEKGKPAPPGKPELIAKNRAMLDQALADGLGVVASLSPKGLFENNPKYQRVDKNGKPYARTDISATIPELPPFFENVGRSMAQAYGDMPAFAAALIDSEVRDNTAISYNAQDLAAWREFAGSDYPPEVVLKNGVDWTKLKDFPQDRVIEDANPILKFYRWFWTTGDGWNALHSALSKGVKTGNSDVWTWFDPAVRQPSISGSGGTVDVLSHWTYTYPDPQRIGLATDQLFAMSAASGRNQRVMKMTQIIWYRSQTAPGKAGAAGDTVAWEDHDPDAAYITIAPMHLREAFWTMLSRPVQGIMYHGWQSLVPTEGSSSAYRFTNAAAAPVLKELISTIAKPLGPTLMQVPDERREVVFLESFTSQMFARRGGYGSNMDWATDVWLALQHSHTPVDVMFEETLLKTGLSGRKVLVMPYCDVLTRSVVDKIAAWQKKGGKIIADEFLCPGLKADITLASFKREKKAAEDKARVLALAADLTKQLAACSLTSVVSCDNPEIIVRTRRTGDALYVFAINDHREAGSYVGQHGLVLENGLPSSGTLTLPLDVASLYDLTTGRQVLPRLGDHQMQLPLDLGPGEGRVFMVLPRALLNLVVTLPESVKQTNRATLAIALTDSSNTAVNAVVPLRVDIQDANGVTAERSGFYGAKAGKLVLDLDIASNDDPGTWQIRVRELASGMEVTKFMRIEK